RVTVAAGEAPSCTFTNTKTGSITITKHTVGGGGTFAFSGSGSGIGANPDAFNLVPTANSDDSKAYPLDGTQVGAAKTFAETPLAGWTLTLITCTGSASPATFATSAGGTFHTTFAVGDVAVRVTVAA